MTKISENRTGREEMVECQKSVSGWLSTTDSICGHKPGSLGAKVTPGNGLDILCGTNIRHFPFLEI